MKHWKAHWFTILVVGATVMAGSASVASAQTNPAAGSTNQAAEEKEACKKNLKVIYAAIQAFEADHHDLPNWLSDLVPQYLADMNVLMCPACRRTGKTEEQLLADPKLPSSYLFEFCPLPLGSAAKNAPTRTRREWKRRQMGLVGSQVPVVRCRQHTPMLNLAFDGRVYESPMFWEELFTNRVSLAELSAPRMFADDKPQAAIIQPRPATAPRVPARDPAAGKQLLDLTRFYNASLTEPWHGSTNNDLATLPTGVQSFGGVQFDTRGIVQLCSQLPPSTAYPAMVKAIPVGQTCQRVHFLHAAGFGNASDEGSQIGAYVVHFATNQKRMEIPIRYGHEVRNWHTQRGEPAAPLDLTVAWTGQNAVSKKSGHALRLFRTTWTNTAPDLEIESIDYVSRMALAAPFLIAITVE
jgi:hypothetical protein